MGQPSNYIIKMSELKMKRVHTRRMDFVEDQPIALNIIGLKYDWASGQANYY